MYSERSLQRVVGTVLAFFLLWMIAMLVPDNGHERTVVASNQLGFVMNGTQYIVDTNAKLNGDQADGRIHVIYYATPIAPRVSSSTYGFEHV